jgi:hypothetical protein
MGLRPLNFMPKGIPKTGTRKAGAGRKSGPLTTTISFRVPIIEKERLKNLISNLIDNYLNQKWTGEVLIYRDWEHGPITAIVENQKPLN